MDGTNHANSSATDRFNKGETEGKNLADKIKSGDIELEDGETIKLIGHSHGASHAMGMAKGLLDARIEPELIQVLLFAPHQSNQIQSFPVNFLLQADRDSDKVSTKGAIAFLTGARNRRIGNNYARMPDGNDGGLGNHGYILTLQKNLGKPIQSCTLTTDTLKGNKVELYSLEVVERMKLGRKVNDGLLITIVTDERAIRIEVGYGLERIIKDEIAARIIREDFAPKFRQSKFY